MSDRELTEERLPLSASLPVRLIGLVAAITGMLAIEPHAWPGGPLHPAVARLFLPVHDLELAAGATALFSMVLLLLGRGLALGRRGAANLGVTLLLLSTLAHIAAHVDRPEALLTGAAALLLYRRRDQFPAVPPRRRVWTVAVVALGVAVTDFCVAFTTTHVLARHRHLPAASHEAIARLVGQPGPWVGTHPGWPLTALTVVGGISIATVLLVAFAPNRWAGPAPLADVVRVRELARREDNDTLGPFVGRRDKSFVFSPDGRAAIGYRCVFGVGLASGDPVGSPGAMPAAVRGFLAECARNGWRPAFYGSRLEDQAGYAAAGLRGFYVGDEAIVDVARFSLDGRAMRPVRQAVSRTRNFGVTVAMYTEATLPPSLRARLRAIARSQRGSRPEHGFSMALGDLLTGESPDCLILVAADRTGTPVAFQRYVPCRGGQALSLDAMRRAAGAPNGVHERLIVEAVDWARENGVAEISLNFAAFRRATDPTAQHSGWDRLARVLAGALEGRFGIQMDSLRRFNRKFRPRWVPRGLVYRSYVDLPAIGLAALSAEGFLPFDRSRERVSAC